MKKTKIHAVKNGQICPMHQINSAIQSYEEKGYTYIGMESSNEWVFLEFREEEPKEEIFFEPISEKEILANIKKGKANSADIRAYYITEPEMKEGVTIPIPKRATKASAGYDFFALKDILIPPETIMLIPTYLKCKLGKNNVLLLMPRSSLGFKYNCTLANTVGVIDSDYYGNYKNDGHILVKLVNNSKDYISIRKGEAFCQGIIINFLTTSNDEKDEKEERGGGIGSTNKDNE